MKEQWYVFGSLFDYCEAMCNDVKNLFNCQFINTRTNISNRLIWLLYKIHNSRVANKWGGGLPHRDIWYKYYFDTTRLLNKDEGVNHFIFFDSNPHVYNPDFLDWIMRKGNCTLSLIFVNSMRTRNFRNIQYFNKYFKYIYTIDSNDAKQYDFFHLQGIHSRIEIDIKELDGELNSDITFAGADKGRGEMLKMLLSKFTAAGLKCDFTVINMKNAPDDIRTVALNYREVIGHTLQSNCILEICVREQRANTLRALEAVMYNKKLLTNNQEVRNLPFYSESMIQVFNAIEDINVEWCREPVEYEYNYDGEFSIIRVLKHISELSMNIDAGVL